MNKTEKPKYKTNAGSNIEQCNLEYMSDMLSQLHGMAWAMELDTLAYLLEMSVLEAKLQIEIDKYP